MRFKDIHHLILSLLWALRVSFSANSFSSLSHTHTHTVCVSAGVRMCSILSLLSLKPCPLQSLLVVASVSQGLVSSLLDCVKFDTFLV